MDASSDKSLLVFLDRNEIKVKYEDTVMDIKGFKDHHEVIAGKELQPDKHKEMPNTDKKLDDLLKKVKQLIKDYNDKDKSMPDDAFVERLRTQFYYYFVHLFKNYKKYFSADPKENKDDTRKCFNEDEFLRKNNTKSEFYKDLFQTKCWLKFLDMKIMRRPIFKDLVIIETFDARIDKYVHNRKNSIK